MKQFMSCKDIFFKSVVKLDSFPFFKNVKYLSNFAGVAAKFSGYWAFGSCSIGGSYIVV